MTRTCIELRPRSEGHGHGSMQVFDLNFDTDLMPVTAMDTNGMLVQTVTFGVLGTCRYSAK
jgi:hypothetical protein